MNFFHLLSTAFPANQGKRHTIRLPQKVYVVYLTLAPLVTSYYICISLFLLFLPLFSWQLGCPTSVKLLEDPQL